MKRWIVLVALVGCVESSAITCGDLTCPAGTRCDELGRCITDDQTAACSGLDENAPCSTSSGAGECISGACISARCGDGIRVGTEQCDGEDLGGETCGSLGFYIEGAGLACNAQCQFNTNACEGGRCGDDVLDATREQCEPDALSTTTCSEIGFYETTAVACTGFCTWNTSTCSARCGDGIIQGDQGEVCDGAPPSNGCLSFGFDYGAIACAGCGPNFARCGTTDWVEQIPSPGSVQSIAGTAEDLWASRGGLVSRRRNFGPWEIMLTANAGSQIVVRAPDDVVVGGNMPVNAVSMPTIWRYNGVSWSTEVLPNANANETVSDIVAVGAELFAVTNATNGALYHHNGTAWSRIAGVANGFRLWASSANDIYISATTPAFLRWNGSVMSPVTLPAQCTGVAGDVWGTSSTNVFVACSGGVARFTGTWSMSLQGPVARSIYGTSANHVIVGGNAGNVWRFDGNDWYDIPSTVGSIDAVWTDGTGVVAASFGFLLALDRSAFQSRTGEVEETPEESLVVGRDAYVTLQNGTLLRRGSATGWTLATPPLGTQNGALWGFSPTDVYVTSGTSISRWTGSWSSFATMSSRAALALWGPAANDLWAVTLSGSTLFIDRWNGAWSNVTSLPSLGFKPYIRGTSSTDVWVARGGDTFHHYDGNTWTPHQIAGETVISAVHPIGPNNAIALGLKTLYRWNGSTWSAEDIGAGAETFLTSVWVGAANDIFVGGSRGTIIHFDGTRWNPVRNPRAEQSTVVWISGTTDRVHFLRDEVGGGDLLYRFAPWL